MTGGEYFQVTTATAISEMRKNMDCYYHTTRWRKNFALYCGWPAEAGEDFTKWRIFWLIAELEREG